MRSIISAVFLVNLFFSQAEAATPLGIGIVKILDLSEDVRLAFFKSPKGPQTKEIRFTKSQHGQLIVAEDPEWLRPETYNPNDGMIYLFFRCIEKRPGWFKVIVNNESGEAHWIQESSRSEYRDWISFLKTIGTISRLREAKEGNPIRREPSSNSEIVNYQGDDCFQVDNSSGDWIEIYVPDDKCGTIDPGTLNSGWIKWREGDRLLVDYAYLGC